MVQSILEEITVTQLVKLTRRFITVFPKFHHYTLS